MKKKLFTFLTLLCLAVTGAWAGDKYFILGAQAVATDGALTKASSHSNLTLKYIKFDGSSYSTTSDISFSATSGINGKFESSATSANISDILTSSKWGTGSGSAYAAGIKFTNSTTYTLSLGSKTISKISLLLYPSGKNASITIGEIEKSWTTQAWTLFEWEGTFTNNVSMELGAKDIYGVFVLEESSVDETAPTFSLTTPATTTNVAIDSRSVVLTASEAVTKVGENVSGTLKIGNADASDINYAFNADTKTLTYTFDDDLDYETTYAFTVDANQVEDAAGNKNAATDAFSFTTKAEPVNHTVTFANAADATGIAPAAQTVESGATITLPKNFTMYKEGYTMTGWSDGTNTYAPGASYTVSDNATLTAVFTANAVSLASRINPVTVKFDFQRGEGAPSVTWNSGEYFWVAQATVNGQTIDVKADIDLTSGKVDNSAWTDWVQLNSGTKITIPSAEGAVVNVSVFNSDDTSTVNGNTRNSIASSVATFNIDAVDATAQFVASGPYYKYIEVVLPIVLTAESAKTWTLSDANEFTDAASADKTYSVETKVNNLIIGGGAQLTNSSQRLKLNNDGYVKIKVTENSKITVSAVGGSGRNVTFAENAVGGTVLGTVACTNSSAEDKVLTNSGSGEKTICIYNSASGNITLYSIKVEENANAAPTSIAVTPASPSAETGETVTLTATVEGGVPTPTIQWYSCDDAEKANANAISGETGTTYTPSTSAEGTYYFYAVATNSEGSVTSNVVTLAVTPSITGQTFYSWNGGTETGGTAVASDNQSVGIVNGGYTTIRLSGKADYSSDYVTVTLNKALKAGDIIKVTAHRNKSTANAASGFKAKFQNGTSTVSSATGVDFVNLDSSVQDSDSNPGTEPNTCYFTVPSDAAGSTTMTMTRSHTSTNLFISKLEIYRPNISLDAVLNAEGLLTADEVSNTANFSFGVTSDNQRVAADAPNAVTVISGKYHNEHGCTGLNVVANVSGKVKITIGQCTFSKSKITIKNSSNVVVAELTPNSPSCWKNDHTKVYEFYYSGDATTLTISGMTYCPYVGIKEVFEVPDVAGTITATGYNTFSSCYPLDLSTISGGTAYVATSVTDGKVVLSKSTAKVPAGTGLMIAGETNDKFTIDVTYDTPATPTNLLVGAPDGATVEKADEGQYNYVFGWTEVTNPGFYLINATSATLPAGKAYLQTSNPLSTSSPARLAIAFENEATGISEMETMRNVGNGKFYNLNGQQVAQPTKGLYIVNGKKVMVK